MKNQKIDTQPKFAATHAAHLLQLTVQAIHKKLKTLDITMPKIGNKSYITPLISRKLFNIKFERKKISFQIVKGGTGKTTALHNISCAASLYGAKILVVDLDPQGNLTDAFGVNADEVPVLIDIIQNNASVRDAIVEAAECIDIIPSRIENVTLDARLAISKAPLHNVLSNILQSVEANYDFILIDCPPMMGHSVTAATLYADLVLVPLNPDKFSAKGLKILKDEIDNIQKQYKMRVNYKVFLNKFSGNTILSDKAIQTTIASETEKGNALTTAIRQAQEIPNTIDSNTNIFSVLKQSTPKNDFDLLTRELLNIKFNTVKEEV